MYAIYQAICDELGLDAAGEQLWAKAVASKDSTVLRIRHRGGQHTWGLIAADLRWGCELCLRAAVDLIDAYYADQAEEAFHDEGARELLSKFFELHQVALSVTNAYAPQNWSVCFPVAMCSRCGAVPRPAAALREVFIHDLMTAPNPVQSQDTGGVRSVSAETFIAATRAAIGYAAIVGNPYDGGEEPAAVLIEGPVRTSLNAHDNEVAGGKGRSEAQAIASFLGEALERYFLTGIFGTARLVAGESDLPGAVSPIAEFGYPASDEHPTITPYSTDLSVEWLASTRLDTEADVFMPADMALCPERPRDRRAEVFSVGSTTGASAGATVDDATTQALLELIERDAFWYYARTRRTMSTIAPHLIPMPIKAELEGRDGRFVFHVLDNPFGVPVVHATYRAHDPHGSRSARGIGAAASFEQACMRAYVECLQMYHSLSLGIEVDESAHDMRALWYRGTALTALPNFFDDTQRLDAVPQGLPDATLGTLLTQITRAGHTAYRTILTTTGSFAVVRVALTAISVSDATYFRNNDRLTQFSVSLGHGPAAPAVYRGSTYM